ncbi:molybdopterin-synthase adenylyltransferase MoeB [soil metagenome]
MLSEEEIKRYSRQIKLSSFGIKGQERLKQAKVFVVGAGGLGTPVIQYLSAAGVGTLGIIDFDQISESNLHRQVLYSIDEVGKNKTEVIQTKIRQINPFVEVITYQSKLNAENALDIIADYDLVIDGTDNFATRYIINDACLILDKPFIYGAIHKSEGQVTVFNLKSESGENGPTYRCLFPEPPEQSAVPNCAEVGVLGILPGIVGSFQANEAIKIITQSGEILNGQLLIMDVANMTFRKMKFKRQSDYKHIQKLADHDLQCESPGIKSITVEDLQKLILNEKIQLIDVREQHELEICKIESAIHIPLGNVLNHLDEIAKDKKVVVYCHYGMRSASAINLITKETGQENLYNLEGGINEWAREIDPDMEVY